MFNSFKVELPDDPLSESFVRELLKNEILQELVKTIHFLSNGIMLTNNYVNNDGDQILKVCYNTLSCALYDKKRM